MIQAKTPDHHPVPVDEIDWEVVFESPKDGFVTLVKQAQSVNSLQQCAGLIIDKLFTRENDGPFLAAYHTALKELLPVEDGSNVDVSFSKKRVIVLLRDIKQHRQRKAAKHVALSRQAPDEIEKPSANNEALSANNEDKTGVTEKRRSKTPPSMPGLAAPVAKDSTPPADDTVEIFSHVFCTALNGRFRALYAPIEQVRKPGDRLPFVLSEDFSRHFEDIVQRHIVPSILESSRGLVKMILEQPQDQRRKFMTDYLESRNGRQVLWEKWQDAWKAKTQQTPLPPKPKNPPKKSFLGGFSLKKEKKVPAWKREKTPEEWQELVTTIKKNNKEAAKVWAEIAIDSNSWQPPEEADNKLLMDMFARSIKGLQKQSEGLRQIVRQGDNVARLLTNFAKGKDIDLALLAACYQHPDLFIGKKSALTDMMAGYTQKEVDQDFALVARYLPKYI